MGNDFGLTKSFHIQRSNLFLDLLMAPRKNKKKAVNATANQLESILRLEPRPSYSPPPPNLEASEDPQVQIDSLEEENCTAKEQLCKVQEQCEKLQQMV